MGYQTQFRSDDMPDFMEDFLAEYILGWGDYSPLHEGADACKWYSHMKDLATLSAAFPDVPFSVYGEGEEAGDLWVAYFSNGRSQRYPAEIVYPDCDPDAWSDPVPPPEGIDKMREIAQLEARLAELKESM